ncbi:hypothetical protein ACE0DR_03440 [Azotobacter sp. CWF10]
MSTIKEELQKEIEQGMNWLEAFDQHEAQKAEALLTHIERLSEQIDRIFMDEMPFHRQEPARPVQSALPDDD